MRELKSVDEAIEVLGGLTKAAAFVGRRAQHAYNWRAADRFPAKTFPVLQKELENRGCIASSELWGIKAPSMQGAS